MKRGQPPMVSVIVLDDGPPIAVDCLGDNLPTTPRSAQLQRLAEYVLQLRARWIAREAGFDHQEFVEARDALRTIDRDEKREKFLQRTKGAREDQVKEADITLRRLQDAERELRAAGTPERNIRTLAARQAGVTRPRADQVLGPVAKAKHRRKSKAQR